MSYCDTPEEFDLDLFMKAMGYDEGYIEPGIGDDVCLWSDHELTFVNRDGDEMTITTTEIASPDVQHDVTIGRATVITEHPPERLPPNDPVNNPFNREYSNRMVELQYRLPWPTTFNEAFASFAALGWFGKLPNARMQLMQTYEWLAAGVASSDGHGTLRLWR
jgi:hypothetical protein